jgi:hypothetical protein
MIAIVSLLWFLTHLQQNIKETAPVNTRVLPGCIPVLVA